MRELRNATARSTLETKKKQQRRTSSIKINFSRIVGVSFAVPFDQFVSSNSVFWCWNLKDNYEELLNTFSYVHLNPTILWNLNIVVNYYLNLSFEFSRFHGDMQIYTFGITTESSGICWRQRFERLNLVQILSNLTGFDARISESVKANRSYITVYCNDRHSGATRCTTRAWHWLRF